MGGMGGDDDEVIMMGSDKDGVIMLTSVAIMYDVGIYCVFLSLIQTACTSIESVPCTLEDTGKMLCFNVLRRAYRCYTRMEQ